jgi:hypothetical protein
MSVVFLHPYCGVVTAVIIVIFFAVFFNLRSMYKHNDERKWLVGSIVALSIAVAGIGFEVFLVADYYDMTNHKTLKYSLVLDSASDEFEQVYVPISQSSDLQNTLRIKSGTGTFSIVNAQQGLALWVNFSRHIEITGRVETLGDIGERALTMLNFTDEYWERVEHWMGYDPHDSSDYNCSFRLWMHFNSIWESETYESAGYLNEGWETHWAEYSLGVA